MPPHLFVYGTLRSAFRNRYARLPALRPSSGRDHWVSGEIYRLRTPAPLLAKLDTYEGPVYQRVQTQAVFEDGRRLAVWVYEYCRSLPWWRGIASGDYLKR